MLFSNLPRLQPTFQAQEDHMHSCCKYAAMAVAGLFAAAGLAVFPASAASGSNSNKPAATAKPSANSKMMSDSDFAKAAAEGGLAEIRFGTLAEDKASNKSVKDLAERIVTDHTDADNHLQTAASKDGLTVRTNLDAKDLATYKRLSDLSGADFDRAYARDMVRDHQADIAMFKREANYGKDASIKSFAAQTLPTLEDHLKLAREALESVSPKTGTKGTSTKKQSS
jgi:putative membrane protein